MAKATKKSTKKNTGVQLENAFMQNMRNIISGDETLGKESSFIPSYSLGLDVLDYRNGRMEDGETFTGVDGGKILYVVGNSGTGKSTLVIQAACAIADTHALGSVFHYDCERSTTRARIRKITGWTKDKFLNKYFHIDKNTGSESFYKLIKAIADEKVKNREEYEFIDENVVDDFGNPVVQLPPTVFILDSLATLIPNDIEAKDELGGQMDATAAAKKNTQIFKGIMNSLISANITLIVINHINEKVDINPMAKKQAQVNFLKQDETLPGGKAPIYLSNTLIKLIAFTKLDPSKDYGVKGFLVKAQLIKSRSNAAGNEVTLVFEQEGGFSNALTSWQFLKEQKVIQGSGHGYWLPNLPEVKVKQKDIIETYKNNEEFREALDECAKEHLTDFLTKVQDGEIEIVKDGSDLTLDDVEYYEEHELYYHAETDTWYDYDEEMEVLVLVEDDEE